MMEPVAVVGFAFKLPGGANDADSLWEIIENGKNVSKDWPESRINIQSFHDTKTQSQNLMKARGGHFLEDDPASFDAPFFSITAKEAASMDPQQRFLLEISYLALENAGIPIGKVSGTPTSMYEASMADDYSQLLNMDPDASPRNAATGTARAMLANRISWYFNLQGPSLHIDTACSGSMVALDLACSSLRNGESSMSLVAGSNLMLSPVCPMMLSRMNFLSPDSVCYSFDERANGYARGEGIIVMVLKRLTDALHDGDTIRAVIRSSGTNQDGRTPGLTQPSGSAQEQLIRSVYAKAGLDIASTRYVEAHGTGTPVGDPIEVQAIGRVFRASRSETEPLFVGSVKANIGHLEGGSGLAGVLKSILMLERGLIPPNALFQTPNPDLDNQFYNIRIPTELMKWPSEGVRRVSINSFGFGGTNAHVVIDDAFHYLKEHSLTGNTCSTSKLPGDNDSLPSSDDTSWVKPTITASGCRLLVFSAADEKGLCRTRDDILRYYRQKVLEGFATLDDFAFTLSARRSNLNWRCHAVVDPETSHLKTDVMVSTPYRSSQQHGAAFIFTGQGAEHHQMGLELLLYPVFRDALDEIDSILSSFGCKWSIVDELQKSENISQAEYSQPICTGIQIALIKLLASLNICPVAVLGHSSGEIAAAYCVGALSMESACKVAYYRGLLAGKMKAETSVKGAMMSVNLPADGFQEYIDQTFDPRPDPFNLSVACINSPKNITVSGDDEAIDVLKEALDRDKIFAMKLSTGIAYHTPAMAAIAGEYERAVGELKPQYQGKNRVPLFSTVTGTQVPASMMSSAGYWVRNLLSPVLFNSAMSALLGSNNKAQLGMPQSRTIYDLIEVGPSAALQRPCRDILEVHFRGSEVRYASVLERKRSSMKTSLSLVGALHDYGYPVSITSANRQSVTPAASPNCLADLPQYPFDRTQHYWHESRISRDYRLRAHVPKTVLGAQTLDYTPLQPRWRKIINTKETPWVADHVVSGSCIFPGTGMLIMALEAARQGAIGTKPLRGFQIKDAVFLNPVVLRENSEGESEVEVICHLRPLLNPNERDASRSEVCISTCHRTLWTECFRCTVQLLYDDALNEVDGGAESKLAAESARTLYNSAVEKCATPLPSTSFYAYCAERGITYGSSFSILQNIRWNKDGTATGVVDVSQPSSSYEGLVHPAIVDAACQVCWLAPSRGLTESMPTEVPRRLQDMYVAAVGWKSPETSRVRICSSASFKEAGRGIAGTITILADDGSLLCKVGRLELAPVADDIQSESYTRKLLHGIDWQPCLSMLSPLQLAETCKAPSAPAQAPSTEGDYQKLIQALKLISRRALADLDDVEIQLAKPHIQRYIAWLRTLEETSSANSDNSTTSLEQKLGEIERARPQWEVHTAVARNLLQILRGEVDPLSIIFSTDLAERYYQDIFERSCDSRFQRFLDLFTFEHPELKILEVGAGTGSMTHHVLTALQDRERESGGTRFSRYTYTDISHAFFEDAREKFKGFHDRMDFRILDLEKDVAAQGYGEVEYDLIIAGAVLHTTQNLHATLRNVRKCLKPGGKILFFENVVPDVALQFSFGTLSGWWRGVESWRNGAQHQCTSESQWDDLLLQSGFSGNDLLLEGPDEHTRTFSIIVSTAIGDYPDRATKRSVLLCMDSNSKTQGEFANGIIKSARFQENCVFKILGIDELSQVEIDNDDQVVMLHEIDGSLLQCLTTQQLQALQLLMRTARNILWITKTVIGDQDNAFVGMTTGFLRTMRSEATNSRIVRLNLEQAGPQSLDGIDETVAVLERCFQRSAPEVEYFLRNGRIMLGRLCEASALNEAMLDAIYPKLHSAAWQEGPDVMLDVGTPGNLDTLRFIPDPIPREQLGPHDVEIDARAWGLNFRDVFIALGRMDEKEFGLDTAGYVRRVGSKCVTLKVGDRVVMARCGSLRKYPRAEERVVIKIPGWLSFDDAASLPAPAMTAYHCLVDVAHLQPGERVLIHSAAGATGQLAVQLALKIGAEIFATVSSAEKKQMLHRTYGIPADHIFYSRKSSFAECVLRMTKGQGVDVILNSLAGDGLRGSWECIGPFGRFIEIGKADIQAGSMLPMGKFEQNVSYSAVDVRQILVVRKEVAHGLLKTAIELLEAGHVRCPHPRHVYPVSKIEHAFRFLQSGKNFGRIVINNAPDDIVPKLLTTQSTWTFSADASYLIAGGLGGIGRAISRWMVEKGARHLILPSRSGPRAPVALELIQELEERGVSIMAPVCDVGSAQSLEDLLTRCQGSIPAIRGCINAAMDLQDSIFEHMTHTQWQSSVQAKVATSWNLHSLLPRGLDFFVLLSSLAGVYGNVSQANYAAGNTFQDALAEFRISQGEEAVSINLGWMRTIGAISEKEEYQNFRMKGADMAKIEEQELLSLLTIYCDPSHQSRSGLRSQVLMGTVTPRDLLSKGVAVPASMKLPLFSTFATCAGSSMIADSGDGPDLAGLFKLATEIGEKEKLVADALAQKLARSLSVLPEDIDRLKPLFEYGVDSLVAVELRNWLGKEFGADVPVFDIMGGATIAAMGVLTVKNSRITS